MRLRLPFIVIATASMLVAEVIPGIGWLLVGPWFLFGIWFTIMASLRVGRMIRGWFTGSQRLPAELRGSAGEHTLFTLPSHQYRQDRREDRRQSRR